MQNLEHQTAVAFVHWWTLFSRTKLDLDENLLFSIPNQGRGGGWQAARRGAYMKAEGLRKGMPDYMLAVPRNGKHGLFLELKKGGVGIAHGRASKEQLEFGAMVQEQGYSFVIAHGLNEAIDAVEKYLK